MILPGQPSPARLGVYVQVPFCQRKCAYCNFATGVFPPSIHEPYVAAICREINLHQELYRERGLERWKAEPPNFSVDTMYLGGGTPSLLDPALLARILKAVRERFPGVLEEVTLEADPETVNPEKAAAWREAGFNRISLGVQSFADAELRASGRLHRRKQVFSAVERLRAAGLENLSFDLIAGLPHQTAGSWQDSLDALLELRPPHASIYLLELDDGSRLGREALAGGRRYGVPSLPEEDAVAEHYGSACAQLARHGYEHYEISNWALPGFRSRHNLKYWRRQPYLGFGAGAHSFDGAERWANAHDPGAYLHGLGESRLALDERERVTAERAVEEELFLGLRQLDGIDLEEIEQRYGVCLGERVEPLVAEGLLENQGGRLSLAPSRVVVSNEVFVRLLA